MDADPSAAAMVAEVVGRHGRAVTADASATGLPDGCADVVIGEAMLTMQTDRGKRAIIDEAARLLKPGGRYAIHELGLRPDDLDAGIRDELRKDLARTIKVNAPGRSPHPNGANTCPGRPRGRMDRLRPDGAAQLRRNLADEGFLRVLRIAWNVLTDPGARKRVMAMRRTFVRHADHLTGIALIARKPA
ncbi:MAG: class I SAM-dependent methyltransferase [Micropruina sp.]